MISFNQKFSLEFSPSLDEETCAAFEQAYWIVREFSPKEKTVEICFAQVQSSFSNEIRKKCRYAVEHFLGDAKKELDRRVQEIGMAMLVEATGRLKLTEREERALSQRRKEFSPYLAALLRRFSSLCQARRIIRKEDLEEALRAFNEECDAYKCKQLEGGMITSNLEQEIALAKEQARLRTEQEKSKIEEYTSLSDSLKELLCWDSGVPLETLLYVTPFVLSEIDQLLDEFNGGLEHLHQRKMVRTGDIATAAYLVLSGLTPSKIVLFPIEGSLLRRIEIIKKILTNRREPFQTGEISFLVKFCELTERLSPAGLLVVGLSVPYEDMILATERWIAEAKKKDFRSKPSTLKEQIILKNLNRFSDWVDLPETQQFLERATLLHREAERMCKENLSDELYKFLLGVLHTPTAVAEILKSLSDNARAVLKHEPTENVRWLYDMVIKDSALGSRAGTLSYVIEYALPLVEYLKRKENEDTIKGVFLWLMANDPYFRTKGGLFDPYAFFPSLSPDTIQFILQENLSKNPLMLMDFLRFGGNIKIFRKIRALYERVERLPVMVVRRQRCWHPGDTDLAPCITSPRQRGWHLPSAADDSRLGPLHRRLAT